MLNSRLGVFGRTINSSIVKDLLASVKSPGITVLDKVSNSWSLCWRNLQKIQKIKHRWDRWDGLLDLLETNYPRNDSIVVRRGQGLFYMSIILDNDRNHSPSQKREVRAKDTRASTETLLVDNRLGQRQWNKHTENNLYTMRYKLW